MPSRPGLSVHPTWRNDIYNDDSLPFVPVCFIRRDTLRQPVTVLRETTGLPFERKVIHVDESW